MTERWVRDDADEVLTTAAAAARAQADDPIPAPPEDVKEDAAEDEFDDLAEIDAEIPLPDSSPSRSAVYSVHAYVERARAMPSLSSALADALSAADAQLQQQLDLIPTSPELEAIIARAPYRGDGLDARREGELRRLWRLIEQEDAEMGAATRPRDEVEDEDGDDQEDEDEDEDDEDDDEEDEDEEEEEEDDDDEEEQIARARGCAARKTSSLEGVSSPESDWSLVSASSANHLAAPKPVPERRLPTLPSASREAWVKSDALSEEDLPQSRLNLAGLSAISAALAAAAGGAPAAAALEAPTDGPAAGAPSDSRSLGFTREELLARLDRLEENMMNAGSTGSSSAAANRPATAGAASAATTAAATTAAAAARRPATAPVALTTAPLEPVLVPREDARHDARGASFASGRGAAMVDAARALAYEAAHRREQEAADAKLGFALGGVAVSVLAGDPYEAIAPGMHPVVADEDDEEEEDDDEEDDDDDENDEDDAEDAEVESGPNQTERLNASLLAAFKGMLDRFGPDSLPGQLASSFEEDEEEKGRPE